MTRRQKWALTILMHSMGAVAALGCVTDAQLRDFVTSTAVRTFWQAVSEAVRAAFIANPTTG